MLEHASQPPRVTDLDFPDDRLYSSHFFWFRKTLAGPLECGLHFPALQRSGEVYYCRLPRMGSRIEPGEPFGFIEGDGWVWDLQVPFSGRICRVNFALEDEPGRVADSPFEEGWIVAFDQVSDEDLEKLHESAEAKRWLDFLPELRGELFELTERWREEDPWWQSLSLRLGGKLLVAGQTLDTEASSFEPSWAVGDRWYVHCVSRHPLSEDDPMTSGQLERIWQVDVDRRQLDVSEKCYRLLFEAIEDGGESVDRFGTWYSRNGLRLTNVEQLPRGGDVELLHWVRETPHMPIWDSAPFPFDWPWFPTGSEAYRENEFDDGFGNVTETVRQDGDRLLIEWERFVEEQGVEVRTTFEFVRGDPWPVKVTRFRDGEAILIATLLLAE